MSKNKRTFVEAPLEHLRIWLGFVGKMGLKGNTEIKFRPGVTRHYPSSQDTATLGEKTFTTNESQKVKP